MRKSPTNYPLYKKGNKLFSRKIKIAFLFAFLIFFNGLGYAAFADNPNYGNYNQNHSQQSIKKVTGTVTDYNDELVTGVSVCIKGTRKGVSTDINGKYSLRNVPTNAILVFQFIGMETLEIPVNGKTIINAKLEKQISKLDEVVVVGYSKQKKISVTGSISAIQTEEIKKSPAANIKAALTGRMPGLSVTEFGGRPGGNEIYMSIRGGSPLILVDGVPRDNINQIDPNEVADFTILKDASATAVFGIRGANGVILITTKEGTRERPTISFSCEYGLQRATKQTHMLDSWEYAEMRNQALINDGYSPKYSQRQIELMKDGTNPFYPNNDWYSMMLNKFAPMSRYNVNMSGGNKRFKYFFNAGFLVQKSFYDALSKDELGYDPEFKLEKYNFRTNVEMKVNNWIKAGVKIAGYVSDVNGSTSQASKLYVAINSMTPVTPGPISPAGWEQYGIGEGYAITPDGISNQNPYAILNYTGYNKSESNNLNTTAYVNFNLGHITKGLTTKLMGSFDAYAGSYTSGKKGFDSYQFDINEEEQLDGSIKDLISFTPESEPQFHPLTLSKSSSFYYKINLQWVTNYKRTFNKKHAVTGMILAQRDDNEVSGGSSEALLPHKYLGIAGRATYQYDKRYLAEFNIGYNGSEQFAKGKRFGVFPAVSLGWIISNERFMKPYDFVSNLKLRASYGKVGDDQISGSRFLYLDKMNIKSIRNNSISDLQVTENVLGNPNVTWEVAYKQNYGIDLDLFKNQIGLSVDIYKDRRENILITRNTIPEVTGLVGIYPKENDGITETKGIEVELKFHKRISNDFIFSMRNLFSYSLSKYIFVDEASRGDSYYLKYTKQGHAMGMNIGYVVDWDSKGHGYWTSEEEINQFEFSGIKPRVGDLKYKDLTEDGVISDEDKNLLGRPGSIRYSSILSFSYKAFDLSLMLQGVGLATKNFTAAGVWEYGNPGYYFEYQKNNWTQERYDNGEEISYPALSSYRPNSNHTKNSYFTSRNDYLRLKNAEIGYTFSPKMCDKLGVEKLRIYVNGSNLLTWTDSRFSHLDPEIGRSPLIPITQIFNFGVNVTL